MSSSDTAAALWRERGAFWILLQLAQKRGSMPWMQFMREAVKAAERLIAERQAHVHPARYAGELLSRKPALSLSGAERGE